MSTSNRTKALWLAHLGLFVLAQLGFALTDNSWPVAFLNDAVPDHQSFPMIISRVWLIVFTVDTIWSWWSIADRNRKAARPGRQPLVTRRDERS